MKTFFDIYGVAKFEGNHLTCAQRDIKANTQKFVELNAVIPSEVRLYYSRNDENNSLSYEYLEIYITGTNIKISEYKNRYRFYMENSHVLKYKNLSNNDISKIGAKFTPPNYIGVGKLTLKKVQDWINYLKQLEQAYIKENDENGDFEKKYKEKIADQKPYYYNDKKGYIEKNGLRYDFEINAGHVFEKLQITCSSTFENFLKLSDNKL